MQISPINLHNLNFKSKSNKNIIGYDDTVSQSARNFIRKHYNPIPYYDILEGNGRLEEYELNKLISSLVGKNITLDNLNNLIKPKHKETTKQNNKKVKTPKSKAINLSEIKKVSEELCNVKSIPGTESSYRGSAGNLNKWALKTLAKAGIKNIIVLTTTMIDEKDCKNYGLSFMQLSPEKNIFENEAFQPKPCLKLELSPNKYEELGITKPQIEHVFTKNTKTWEKNKKAFIKDFIKFIQTMQKDNVYIGCDFGTYKTDEALMLNHLFNPQASSTLDYITKFNQLELLDIENLYNNLKTSDKKQLNWTEKFDKAFLKKLDKTIKKYKI